MMLGNSSPQLDVKSKQKRRSAGPKSLLTVPGEGGGGEGRERTFTAASVPSDERSPFGFGSFSPSSSRSCTSSSPCFEPPSSESLSSSSVLPASSISSPPSPVSSPPAEGSPSSPSFRHNRLSMNSNVTPVGEDEPRSPMGSTKRKPSFLKRYFYSFIFLLAFFLFFFFSFFLFFFFSFFLFFFPTHSSLDQLHYPRSIFSSKKEKTTSNRSSQLLNNPKPEGGSSCQVRGKGKEARGRGKRGVYLAIYLFIHDSFF